MLQKGVCEKRGWASGEELIDFFAVAQCLPGIIAVNVAILVGNKVKGRAGGLFAALGVVAPSLAIIMIIAAFLQSFIGVAAVQRAFWGIRIVVSALIAQAVIKLWKGAMKGLFGYALFAAALALALFTGLPTAALVVGAVAAGIARGLVAAARKGGEGL
jgi:chromate transporter